LARSISFSSVAVLRPNLVTIVGDAGVHEKCGNSFWQEVAETLSTLLKQGHFTAAVLAGIDKAGKGLAEHFPRDRDDRNELPDQVERD